jgi:NADPH2:quinone reductase
MSFLMAALSEAILLSYLSGVARGDLDPQVGWRGSWTQITEAVDAFRGRQVRGKAVLDVHNAI